MEEAERLCDRVAVIEAGRVAAVGSPAGLAGRLGGEQRIHCRPVRVVAAQLAVNLAVALVATAGILAVGRLAFGGAARTADAVSSLRTC